MSAFRHVESDRVILFGLGAREAGAELIGSGYTLLTTARAARAAPEVAQRAGEVVEVASGLVEDVAGNLLGAVAGTRLVALGGGRVIDVAKALVAAGRAESLLAIPTTLSGAEMTRLHRHARGVPADAARVRPGVVVNDPALSASQPVDQLAASTANALGHAMVAGASTRADPLSRAAALDAVRHLAAAWREPTPDREEMALGALLAGWAVDHSGLGLHHALAQTVVRTASLDHAGANVALLPETVAACRRRVPAAVGALDAAAGEPLEALARRLRDRVPSRPVPATELEALLETALDAVAARSELDRIPPPPDRAELRRILVAALTTRPS